MKTIHLKYWIIAGLLLVLNANVSMAASSMKELQERFKQRLGDIRQLKDQGTIGETFKGYIEFVEEPLDSAAELVKAENADRRELYQLIADQESTTPEKVAARNAKRNFEKAKPGDYLKHEDGQWRRKK